jgi:hypothetical protein
MSNDNCTDGAGGGQAGTRLVDLTARLVRARRRADAIEGNPIDAAEPEPELVRGIRALFDNPNPQVASLQSDFLALLERDVDALDRRLDRVLKITASIRRQNFRVIDGGAR